MAALAPARDSESACCEGDRQIGHRLVTNRAETPHVRPISPQCDHSGSRELSSSCVCSECSREPLLISGSKVRVLDGPPIKSGSSRVSGLPEGALGADCGLNEPARGGGDFCDLLPAVKDGSLTRARVATTWIELQAIWNPHQQRGRRRSVPQARDSRRPDLIGFEGRGGHRRACAAPRIGAGAPPS